MYSVLIICYILSCVFVPTFQNAGCNAERYYWRDFNFGSIPYDAVEIAKDGKYIAQVYMDGGLIPATIYPHLEIAVAELYGKQIIKENIKILCTLNQSTFYWDPVDFSKTADDQMRNIFVGGFYKSQFKVFIGRLYHEGQWKVGKVIPYEDVWKGLIVWDAEGKPVRVMKFDMLKCNSTIQ